MLNNKKKIIVIILIIVAVIVGALLTYFIVNNSKINQVKERISQIKTEELQKNIIDELKNTSLNINNSSMETYFGTETNDSMDMALSFYYGLVSQGYSSNKNNEGYVYAFVSSKNRNIGVMIPCFKIESDNNGNVKNIVIPNSNRVSLPIKKVMWDTLEKVFNEKYNIDISNYKELGKGTCGISGSVNIMTSNDNVDFTVQVFKEFMNKTDATSWNETKEKLVRNGNVYEDFEVTQEVFGIETIGVKDKYLEKSYIIEKSDVTNNNIQKTNSEILFTINNKYINKYGYITDFVDNSVVEINGIKIESNQEKISDDLLQNLNELYKSLKENELLNKIDLIDISNQYDIKIYINSEHKVVKFGNFDNINTKCIYVKNILELEKENTGEIIVNVDLDNGEKPYFREISNENNNKINSNKSQTTNTTQKNNTKKSITDISINDELNSKVMTVVKDNESEVWTYKRYNIYKVLDNGMVVLLVKYTSEYSGNFYMFIEVDIDKNEIVKITDVFPKDDFVEPMFNSTKW